MTALQQLREGFNQAWGRVVEGWEQLSRQASGALTRFTRGRGEKSPEETRGRSSASNLAKFGPQPASLLASWCQRFFIL